MIGLITVLIIFTFIFLGGFILVSSGFDFERAIRNYLEHKQKLKKMEIEKLEAETELFLARERAANAELKAAESKFLP